MYVWAALLHFRYLLWDLGQVLLLATTSWPASYWLVGYSISIVSFRMETQVRVGRSGQRSMERVCLCVCGRYSFNRNDANFIHFPKFFYSRETFAKQTSAKVSKSKWKSKPRSVSDAQIMDTMTGELGLPWAFVTGEVFVYCRVHENTKKLMRWLFLKKSYAMHFNFSCLLFVFCL